MKKKNNKGIVIGIVSLFLVMILLLGITYAYYRTRIIGNQSNNPSLNIISDKLILTYQDGSANIVLEELEPSDNVYSKTFSVRNDSESELTYGVYLIDVINTFERKEDIKYTLTCSEGCSGVSSDIFPNTTKQLVTNRIDAKSTQTYILSFTYLNKDEDQSVDMGKVLSAKVQIFGPEQDGNYIPFEESTLAYSILNNAKNNLNGTQYVDTPPSKVAEEPSLKNWELGTEGKFYYNDKNISSYANSEWELYDCYNYYESCSAVKNYLGCTDDVIGKYAYDERKLRIVKIDDCENGKIVTGIAKYESVLSATEDDYGTSYYYRGKVENNYVNFAGMCWRIVRIAGDSSTKLVLEDKNYECDNELFTGNWSIGQGNGNYGYELKNVNSDTDNEAIMSYLIPVEKKELSMVKAFYDFQTNELKSYTDKLKAGDWCLGDKAYLRNGTYGSYTFTPLEEYIYNYKEDMFYESSLRLASANTNTYQPTLKCNGKVLKEFADVNEVSVKMPMYVGTLTADEVVFAGSTLANILYSYHYLTNYFSSEISHFLTLSPYSFSGSYDKIIGMSGEYGTLFSYGLGSSGSVYDPHFRPAVSLKADIKLISGDGTQKNPYVVE